MYVIRITALSILLIGSLGIEVTAFAQGLTRAEVRADLIRLDQAGYNPNGTAENYPQDIQAAEAKVAALQADSSVGGSSMSGTSAAGAPVAAAGDVRPACVGPVSYCNIFAGS
ncbi:DUF4148 domain-containing protein [Paraburkholderia sp. J12]|uniref:DUF4148 domain-containing protein n=1 Tax=Paraburkholderia sp. J12 TaxID=2805432 RepID=UPI002ABE8259|nr:DUF4148 domain-containing protein [Paraburkholderia sp. J12]